MRQPPRKLDVRKGNPDCLNVKLTLRGEKINNATSYNLDTGILTRYSGDTKNGEWLEEAVKFSDGELVVEWIDPERVTD